MTPWAVRNYNLFGKLMPTVSHPWHEIWRGSHPRSSGGEIALNSNEKLQLNHDIDKELMIKMDALPYDELFEIRVDRLLKKESIKHISNDIPRFIALCGKRLMHLWILDFTSPRATNPIYASNIIIIWIGFWYGIIQIIKKKQIIQFLPFFLFAFFYSSVVSLINYEARYQVYLVTIMTPIAGLGWWSILNQNSKIQKLLNW